MRAHTFLPWALLTMVLPSIGSATTVRPPTFETLVAQAEAIVRGVVTSVRCEWRGQNATRRIVTLIRIHNLESIVGAASPDMELEFLGGEVDGEGLHVAGQPQFRIGDEDILFIAGNGRQICPLVRMGYGRYLVAKDDSGRRFITRENGVPLAAVAEVKTQLVESSAADLLMRIKRDRGLSPEQFIAAVRDVARQQGRTDVM